MVRAIAAAALLALAACLSSPARPTGDGGAAVDGAAEPDGTLSPCDAAQAARGDVLHYSFDRGVATPVVHDASGRRNDAGATGAAAENGRHGLALRFAEVTQVYVPDHADLFAGNLLTVEAWIRVDQLDGPAAILSDLDTSGDGTRSQVEIHLGLNADGQLEFMSNADGAAFSVGSDEAVATETLVHVAATWDGATVRLYADGRLAGAEEISGEPQAWSESLRVGRINDGGADNWSFVGLIDELRVSSCPKTRAQIEESMRTPTVPSCGNRLLEGAEGCDPAVACCDACAAVDGGACALGAEDGTCAQGLCSLAAPARPAGAIASYEFDETDGAIAYDGAGGDPLNLTLSGAAALSGGALQLAGGHAASTAATKIKSPCLASSEISLDAWVSPGSTSSPEALIAAIDSQPGATPGAPGALVQHGGFFGAIVSSAAGNNLGYPALDAPSPGVSIGVLTHVVITRSADGLRRLYVNGVLRSENRLGGALIWNDDPGTDDGVLIVGDDLGGNRSWVGSIHRLAVYCRALDPAEVAGSFDAGHTP